jgi:ribosomal protein S12 methylthiotransferase accessory factor YcaO
MEAGKDLLESLKKGDFSHKAFDITVYLKAPVFIVP